MQIVSRAASHFRNAEQRRPGTERETLSAKGGVSSPAPGLLHFPDARDMFHPPDKLQSRLTDLLAFCDKMVCPENRKSHPPIQDNPQSQTNPRGWGELDQVATLPRGRFIACNRESGAELAGRVF